jgi:hypothetical protein
VTGEPPLYVRDGSRFVLYDAGRQHTPPIPVPVSVPDELLDEVDLDGPRPAIEGVPVSVVAVSGGGSYVRVQPAPRCPHGSWRACRVRRCPGAVTGALAGR